MFDMGVAPAWSVVCTVTATIVGERRGFEAIAILSSAASGNGPVSAAAKDTGIAARAAVGGAGTAVQCSVATSSLPSRTGIRSVALQQEYWYVAMRTDALDVLRAHPERPTPSTNTAITTLASLRAGIRAPRSTAQIKRLDHLGTANVIAVSHRIDRTRSGRS